VPQIWRIHDDWSILSRSYHERCSVFRQGSAEFDSLSITYRQSFGNGESMLIASLENSPFSRGNLAPSSVAVIWEVSFVNRMLRLLQSPP